MERIDYGDGERQLTCTGWTQVIYEQQFCNDENKRITGDLIADVMGKVTASSDDVLTVNDDGAFVTTVVDYTRLNWNAIRRALWAMLRTAYEISVDEGNLLPEVEPFGEWEGTLLKCEPDMQDISVKVMSEIQRGLFRSGAAASGETSEEAEA